MFKDYKKYLTVSIKVYLFVLLIVVILKIVGLDYFGIEVSNPIVVKINNFASKYGLIDIWYFITLYIYIYALISMSSDDNSKKMKIYCIFVTILSLLSLIFIKPHLNQLMILIFDICFISLFTLIISKFKFKNLLKVLFFSYLNILFQLISIYIRNIKNMEMNDFISAFIMNFDYILLVLITHKIYFMKGELQLCGEAYSSSLKKINLKKSLLNLRKNYQSNLEKFRKKSTQDKITIIIYIILSLLWNTFSVLLIIFVAHINDTFIECLFILSSFWLSKGKFGKPFHFESMITCFIVSNLTYYTLNRVTTPIGISILIPILLGVGLSYVTSKFVKKEYKPLYRGMPLENFEETILKVEEKDSIKYKICKEFYINKISDLSLSFKYNYSVSGIRKIKSRINEKIKKLN